MAGTAGHRRGAQIAVVTLALTAAAVGAASQGQEDKGLWLTAVRFYRPPGPQTLVDVFCGIPLAGLDALTEGGHDAAYRIAVSVRDSSGLELVSQSWAQTVGAAMLELKRAVSAEHFAFAARPGQYAIEVAVTDSASGRVSQRRVVINAYDERPEASDLLLASSLRPAGGGADTAARVGEVRKGSLLLETPGVPTTTPDRSQLGYYLELYPERAETVSVAVRVLGTGGQQVVTTSPRQVAVPARGGVTSGMLSVAGLPPGAYRIELVVGTPDSEVVRDAEFGMRGFAGQAEAGARVQPSDTFATLSEGQLDTMYMPLVYVMSSEEQGVYSSLTVEGKRAFLRQLWAKRDPTPGTPRNEFMERFYRAIVDADRQFREGGASGVPGWRTDRGRIFIRYGQPDDLLNRPQAGSTRPYQVWKYTRGRARKFIFVDATLFGHYELIWTDERREPSRASWMDLLGPEAVEDAVRYSVV